ncbi:hypothetical protein Acr_00g0027050 [Actinidia rufa]|uniref:Alpha/beta-Hydrolases superfamily protein n=1 Tax=Actinidia rufa TaxID=165716 RepID=A0A7J0DFR2_9ERIC|nr:hypothetical protein Acr_00g0027050 [Actinidia rufa]
MGSNKLEVSVEVLPYLRVYKDGTIERIAGNEVSPADLDPQTGVVSKDIVIIPETGVSARLYRPNLTSEHKKLPLVMETEGEDHVFHIFNPNCEKALNMMKCLASFINQE